MVKGVDGDRQKMQTGEASMHLQTAKGTQANAPSVGRRKCHKSFGKAGALQVFLPAFDHWAAVKALVCCPKVLRGQSAKANCLGGRRPRQALSVPGCGPARSPLPGSSLFHSILRLLYKRCGLFWHCIQLVSKSAEQRQQQQQQQQQQTFLLPIPMLWASALLLSWCVSCLWAASLGREFHQQSGFCCGR